MKSKHKLANNEIASFCSQAAMLFNAGIPPADGMEILLQDSRHESGRIIIEQIRDVCNQGDSFYNAVSSTGVFPDYVLNMIHLGEESGNLDTTMKSLADYYDRQEALSDSIKSAVTYPIIMIFIMLLVIIVLITRVLPIFSRVFQQLGSNMSGFSLGLMNLGSRLSSSSAVLVGILAIVLLAYIFFGIIPVGKRIFTDFLNVFPPTKRFYELVACSRFASGIAMTLSSGMDTYESLSLIEELVDNPAMEEKIKACKASLQQGDSFPDALADSGIFSALYSRMIAVGFTTGSVDVVMNRIADRYDAEAEKRIRNIISILEPTLVIILSLIVGTILLSVILPLMGIMSSIG